MRSLMVSRRYVQTLFITLVLVVTGCGTVEENHRKNLQLGLITTPSTYYTTQKARYLGAKYKNNLDRLVEYIVSNPKTASLQFANNIASVGGIGFFTHSAAKSVDERFLEIIMGVPETFDSKLDHNTKVHRIFSLYGMELLSILASDADIYQEKQVSGYGLNLSWRNIDSDAPGPRISLERSTWYFSKANVRSFLQGKLTQNNLLSEAVIFAVVDGGPMKLVSYRPQELKPDLRRPIQEESLITGRMPAKQEAQSEKRESHATVVERPVISPFISQGGAQSPSQTNDKPSQPGSPPVSTGKHEVNEPGSAEDRPDEVPATLSTASKQIEDSALQEKQASVDQAVLESNTAEAPDIPPKLDLASLPASREVPEDADSRKGQLSKKGEESQSQAVEASTWRGAQTVSLPMPKILQGFVIQIAFVDVRDAQHWAETLERRGFAVSLTETGERGSMRLRIGNFTVREEAERQLLALRQDGLKGIVLNLPQPYRPEVRPPALEESAKELPAVQ
jgi:hypothetical protein